MSPRLSDTPDVQKTDSLTKGFPWGVAVHNVPKRKKKHGGFVCHLIIIFACIKSPSSGAKSPPPPASAGLGFGG